MKKRCFHCMREYGEQYEVCPYCGYIEGTPPKEPYYLNPGEILNHRYIVGTVVDNGGFGIIYRAWDAQMEQMVAIKEYFPSGVVNRIPGKNDVIVYAGKNTEIFKKGVTRYLEEAINMGKFSNPAIVAVYDYFQENNTAYIVMEYLDGISIKEYMKKKGGKLSCEETVEIALEVLGALEEIHGEEIIHRDISPDNIFISSNKRIKVIDFGAARLSSGEEEEKFSTIIKPGYAPAEQYRTKSRQGPFTDLYALGACMYHAITGIKPEESLARAMHDELVPPGNLTPDVPAYLDEIIMKAMAMDEDERFQTAKEFQDALASHMVPKNDSKKKIKSSKSAKEKRGSTAFKGIAAIVVTIILCSGAYWGLGNYTRLIRTEHYKGVVNFYVPQSKKDYYGKVVNAFEIAYEDKDITLISIPDKKYKKCVQEKLKQKGKETPAIFVSDSFTDKELTNVENMKKYVADKAGEKNFLYLSDYYKKGGNEKRMMLSFEAPLIVENKKWGKKLNKPIVSSQDFQIKPKEKSNAQKHGVKLYQTNEKVQSLASDLQLDAQYTADSLSALKNFRQDKTAYYITNWSDYKSLLPSNDNENYMNLSLVYPDESVKMKVKLTESISISEKVNIQARMIAEDFVIYMALNQGEYLSEKQRGDSLPLNKDAMNRFEDTWTMNLTSDSDTENTGKVQFDNYISNGCMLEK